MWELAYVLGSASLMLAVASSRCKVLKVGGSSLDTYCHV